MKLIEFFYFMFMPYSPEKSIQRQEDENQECNIDTEPVFRDGCCHHFKCGELEGEIFSQIILRQINAH
jgi:hypothetical protein